MTCVRCKWMNTTGKPLPCHRRRDGNAIADERRRWCGLRNPFENARRQIIFTCSYSFRSESILILLLLFILLLFQRHFNSTAFEFYFRNTAKWDATASILMSGKSKRYFHREWETERGTSDDDANRSWFAKKKNEEITKNHFDERRCVSRGLWNPIEKCDEKRNEYREWK